MRYGKIKSPLKNSRGLLRHFLKIFAGLRDPQRPMSGRLNAVATMAFGHSLLHREVDPQQLFRGSVRQRYQPRATAPRCFVHARVYVRVRKFWPDQSFLKPFVICCGQGGLSLETVITIFDITVKRFFEIF